jgi:hypothetical protein
LSNAAATATLVHTQVFNIPFTSTQAKTMTRNTRLLLLAGAMVSGYACGADLPGIKDIPDIKEGLWTSSATMPGSGDRTMHTSMCTSNAVSRKTYEDTHKDVDRPCKPVHSEHVGSVFTEEMECNFSGKVTHSKSVTTMTGNTGIHIEMRDADNKVTNVIDMKWVSACPAGMKLGDVAGPDGKVMMNLLTP